MSISARPQLITPDGNLTKRAWATLLVLCGALFLDALDVSMIGVALPSIRNDLNLSTSSLQWIVSAYVLGYGGFLLLGGRAADLLGRRRIFLISLGVFLVASGLGGIATGGTVLIITRFIKGVSAAFTAPAGLSIITTNFPEGQARNKALSIYTATGATGFSLGLVLGGVLTEFGWRYVFMVPVAVALLTLLAAIRFVPTHEIEDTGSRSFDISGALSITGSMLLLVYTLVEAPQMGWFAARTVISFAFAAAGIAWFVHHENKTTAPLIRLGIFRSGSLVRANLGAMALFGGWIGFQFILTLYMQQLRGWSALETGLAIFPTGLLVATISPRIAFLVNRFGVKRLITAGMVSAVIGYALFLPIGLTSSYWFGMLPGFLFSGLGFALSFGPLNIAATNGVAPEEQGLAGGLLNTSFQFGGALVLAIVSAVIAGNTSGSSPHEILNGYKAGIIVSLCVAALGLVVSLQRRTSAQSAAVIDLEQFEGTAA